MLRRAGCHEPRAPRREGGGRRRGYCAADDRAHDRCRRRPRGRGPGRPRRTEESSQWASVSHVARRRRATRREPVREAMQVRVLVGSGLQCGHVVEDEDGGIGRRPGSQLGGNGRRQHLAVDLDVVEVMQRERLRSSVVQDADAGSSEVVEHRGRVDPMISCTIGVGDREALVSHVASAGHGPFSHPSSDFVCWTITGATAPGAGQATCW